MKQSIKTDVLVLRGPCGCVKKLFPSGEDAWTQVAVAEARLTRGTLSVVSKDLASVVVNESGRDCPHDMRWAAKCGLTNANLARFGHLDALRYLAPGVRDMATLHKLGVAGGQAFLPGMLLSTLTNCLKLAFGIDLSVAERIDDKVAMQAEEGTSKVVIGAQSLLFGDAGVRAVSADAAMLALGAAAMYRVAELGRVDLLVPLALPQLLGVLRSTKGVSAATGARSTSELVLTLYGAMTAHYLCVDMRLAAVALWIAERDNNGALRGFCASLADVNGSAFSQMGAMDRILTRRGNRDRWLACETSGERATVVAMAAHTLIRGML